MKEINHEYYVSLEVAKLLKEAGFDWKCRGIYVLDSENDPEYVFSTANFTNTSKEIKGYIRLSTPTLEVAQRWLREVKTIQVDVMIMVGVTYNFELYNAVTGDLIYIEESEDECEFDTYEEAQEAGIKKALEIILEKGE